MLRLTRLLPLTALLLALTPACGDDKKGNPPELAGAGGEDEGGAGGATAGSPNGGGTAGEGASPAESGSAGMPPYVKDCPDQVTAPAKVETLSGFLDAGDFAFDELGNYVAVDNNHDLVRISKNGTREVWAPNVGIIERLALLPDGSAILNDQANGAIKRVYPDATTEIVLGGLHFLDGLDIGPDGFIYVVEGGPNRVRRVNPDSGEFTVVAMGLADPSDVAFGDDPKIMYVSSSYWSGVYKVELAEPGELGVAHVFAEPHRRKLPEPSLACPAQEVGKPCILSGSLEQGTCKQLSNVVDCVEPSLCDDKAEGEACKLQWGGAGTCQRGSCIAKTPCDDKQDGDACEAKGKVGTCERGLCSIELCSEDCVSGSADKGEYPPCPNGSAVGDACQDEDGVAGTCFDLGFGVDEPFCATPSACDGLIPGDACMHPEYGPGRCGDQEHGPLVCSPPDPCEGLQEGDSCTDTVWDFEGTCMMTHHHVWCVEPGSCATKPDGEACSTEIGPGTCQDSRCEEDFFSTPCAGMDAGYACWVGDVKGFCTASADGPLECITPCTGKADGDACLSMSAEGTCREGECAVPCSAETEGALCLFDDSALGECEQSRCTLGSHGINGLAVDSCGSVYASGRVLRDNHFQSGNVWRINSSGQSERIVSLDAFGMPSMKWGRGVGGFERELMYVADMQHKTLLEVSVGVPGATEYYDSGAKP